MFDSGKRFKAFMCDALGRPQCPDRFFDDPDTAKARMDEVMADVNTRGLGARVLDTKHRNRVTYRRNPDCLEWLDYGVGP